MRLFLHGRYDTRMLLDRIKKAQKKDADQTLLEAPLSPSSKVSSYSSSSPSRCYSNILLSNWNLDEMDSTVIDALETYLKIQHPNDENSQKQALIHHYQEDDNDQEEPCKEILKTGSFCSQLSLLSEVSHEETPYREVILHNCEGKESLEELIAMLMETNTSLTIRYDKQRKLPVPIARGLLKGAEQKHDSLCRLRSLTFKGTTLTPLTTNYLQMALPLLPNLQDLTLVGNFTLHEIDHQHSSIVGKDRSKMMHVVEALHQTLGNLPQLRNLDLQQCHLPDDFLAHLLEAVYPESIQSLKLNGNMAHEESQNVLYQILSHDRCKLEELDLSWQRLPHAQRNYSILDCGILASVLMEKNTSLETLNLSENRLLDEDVAHLANAFSKHPSLSRIRLQGCRISDRGMMAIAHEVPRWPEHLNHLHLDGNQRIKKGNMVRERIFRAVLKNVFLKELALPFELKSKSTEWALQLNKAGRRALRETNTNIEDCENPAIECTLTSAPSFDSQTGTNQLCDALWPLVLERADTVARQETNREEDSTMKAASVMYLLLREKGFHSVLQQNQR
uniref:Uncharacterized protein n=1 Tax=Pseudo-nitzschia delicatissima TaxID=44447 RepID=A0A7S0XKR4_9STRA|mmetsp:Transcript_1392/g.3207  ORF Transcript_1392/g.3207 Transcript_1392/m.3207 type:complete len:563 (+) Transcript_1392:166-1854(+)